MSACRLVGLLFGPVGRLGRTLAGLVGLLLALGGYLVKDEKMLIALGLTQI